MTEPIKAEADRLIVRVRRTHGEGGSISERHFVHCPRRLETVDLEECLACEYCLGATFDPKDEKYFLSCQPASKAEVERSEGPEVSGLSPADRVTVAAIMTKEVHCVRPDLSVRALTLLLLEKNIGGAPVVDAEGSPIGMVTKTDLVREHDDAEDVVEREPLRFHSEEGFEVDLGPGFHAERILRRTVGEIMTPMTSRIRESATIAEASAMMVYEHLHRLPVVSDEGKVVGIVAALDVLAFVARESGYLISGS